MNKGIVCSCFGVPIIYYENKEDIPPPPYIRKPSANWGLPERYVDEETLHFEGSDPKCKVHHKQVAA